MSIFLQMLLHAGIPNTYVYSDLDPSARKINTAKFQSNIVKVLVVTDVAARGIDIPQLDYVVNFNFPAKPKLFVHRVGTYSFRIFNFLYTYCNERCIRCI